jgi:hypothetical protein
VINARVLDMLDVEHTRVTFATVRLAMRRRVRAAQAAAALQQQQLLALESGPRAAPLLIRALQPVGEALDKIDGAVCRSVLGLYSSIQGRNERWARAASALMSLVCA